MVCFGRTPQVRPVFFLVVKVAGLVPTGSGGKKICQVPLGFRTEEGSRRKCGQYWPLDEGGQEVYGHIAVVNQRVDHHTHYNHTTLELHNTEVRPRDPFFATRGTLDW